ncbi:phosphotransferase [Streptacidiphilus cavernicola]|uniref:D-inositol 3-phosphate glycosyltransferase n=1 Tax=Streptacidiphilus cavernicola TaxID=3342716 RepID=A0ABV6VYD3_9ACTN
MGKRSTPLRVAVLFDTAGFQRSLPLTGAAARTRFLNRALADAGVEVTLLLCDLNPRSTPTKNWPFTVTYLPYSALYEDTAPLVEQVNGLAPDVLVMSNTQLVVRYGRALADAGRAALVYEMHDDEASVTRTIGSGEWEVRQAAVLQAAAVAAADAVVAFTPRDADLAAALRARAVHVVPCGIDPGPVPDRGSERPGAAAFIGNLYYEPNARAAAFLHRRLLPALPAAGSRIEVYGRYPKALRALGTTGSMRLHGPVPNLPAALATNAVGLAPLDSGGGMKLKVLQYMAAGLPIVGSPEAFVGLPPADGFALITADPAMRDLPSLVAALREDQGLRHKLGDSGRSLVKSQFSWDAIARTAHRAYRSACGTAALRGSPALSRDVLALAEQPPYWLHEWRKQEETEVNENRESTGGAGQHPALSKLASEIDCARHAAESALDTVFDAGVVVGYGGRSVVFLGKSAVLKIYTHRSAERARREIAGLGLASGLEDLRIPEIIGHDEAEGALAWVSTSRLDGVAPDNAHDDQQTALIGRTAARLHAMPAETLTGLPEFRRNLRPLNADAHSVGARLSAVLADIGECQQSRCEPGFVHGDFSARNLLLHAGRPPGVIDFEGCGTGCTYEDLTNIYVQNCLIDGRDAAVALDAYAQERVRLGGTGTVDHRHLLFHTARYFRWVLQWAAEIDAELAEQVTTLAPRVLYALQADGEPAL